MERDAYGNYITPGTGWGEIASVASGGSPTLQASPTQLQASDTGSGDQRLSANLSTGTLAAVDGGSNTTSDPAAEAAAAQAAQDAAKAASLRTQVTGLVNTIKDIFNSRYGQVEDSAGEQSGRLNDRYSRESQDLTQQIGQENEKVGAVHASAGTYDSSYRGNNVDTVTNAGKNQIRDLGDSLKDDIAKIAAWVTQQKTGINANKAGLDRMLSHLAETTDLNELTSLRNSIDSKLTELQAGGADYNTMADNASALDKIAPASPRATALKTTLSQILAGNADAGQKSAIAGQLISSSGLSPEDQQALQNGFSTDLQQQEQQPTA